MYSPQVLREHDECFMFIANGDANEVRVSLHTFDFSCVPLESVVWHAFMHCGVDVDSDACSDFKVL